VLFADLSGFTALGERLDPEEVRTLQGELFVTVAEEVSEPQLLFRCYDGLATLHLDLEDLTEAEAYMQKARGVCEQSGVEPDSLTVLPFLA